MPRKLSRADALDRRRRFVEEYLIDFNPSRAATAAGCMPKSAKYAARKMLAEPAVVKAIEAGRAKLSEKSGITAEWVLAELRINHQMARGDGEYAASNKALELLGKQIGMFREQLDVNVDGELRNRDVTDKPLTDDEWAERYSAPH